MTGNGLTQLELAGHSYTGINGRKQLHMAGNGFKWLDMAGMTGIGWTWKEMTEFYWKFLEQQENAGSSQKQLEMTGEKTGTDEDGFNWLQIGWKLLELLEMPRY